MSEINMNNINEEEKIFIIFELMMIIKYIHCKDYILRDLKPNNIIIDFNNTAVVIDFDRVVKDKNCKDVNVNTSGIGHMYIQCFYNIALDGFTVSLNNFQILRSLNGMINSNINLKSKREFMIKK